MDCYRLEPNQQASANPVFSSGVHSPFLALLCLSQELLGLQSSGASVSIAHGFSFCSSVEGKSDGHVNKDLQS